MTYKVLMVGGSLNQTTMMHRISSELKGCCECYFTPFYIGGSLGKIRRRIIKGDLEGLIEGTTLGDRARKETLGYIGEHNLSLDDGGDSRKYDLAVLGTDLFIPENLQKLPKVLVQEGATVADGALIQLLKYVRPLNFLRFLADTAATGMSGKYEYFCVASKGYRELFDSHGINPEKIRVTGIPNFDNFDIYRDFEYDLQKYVLVCPAPSKGSSKREWHSLVEKAKAIAVEKRLPLVFKMHPLEKPTTIRELGCLAPEAKIETEPRAEYFIPRAEVVITQGSSATFAAIYFEKEIIIAKKGFTLESLRALQPISNSGQSAQNIAEICLEVLRKNS